jgi:hypothetical protein
MEAVDIGGAVAYTCNVTTAGADSADTVYIGLQEVHNAFGAVINASSEGRQQMLDIALSAISNDRQVSAYLNSTESHSEISALFVNTYQA